MDVRKTDSKKPECEKKPTSRRKRKKIRKKNIEHVLIELHSLIDSVEVSSNYNLL